MCRRRPFGLGVPPVALSGYGRRILPFDAARASRRVATIDGNGSRGRRSAPSLLIVSSGRRLLAEALAHVVRGDPGLGLSLASDPVHDAQAAVRASARTRPDLILLDTDGDSPSRTVDLIHRLKRATPRVTVLVLFAHGDDRQLLILDYIEGGADGFVDRGHGLDQVLGSLRAAADGAVVLPQPDVVEVLRRAARERDVTWRAADLLRSLTEREREILELMPSGMSNEAIADELHVSVRTIATHLQNVYRKMGVHSRLEAVAVADRLGLPHRDAWAADRSDVG